MESFSRTLENYTGSYLAKRRRKRVIVALALIASAALLTVIAIRLGKSGAFSKIAAGSAVSKQQVLSDWGAKKWDAVRNESLTSSAVRPLDAFFLTFRGLASYYKGMDLPEGEDRAALVDEAIVSLRKALATGGRMPKAQVEYVLGKAYYDKGDAYFDEAAKYLEMSLAAGYFAADSREYLAMAYVGLGNKPEAVKNFEAALSKNRSDLLLIAAAKAYVDADMPVKAEALLLEVLANGKDDLAKENGRFVLGDIYKARGDNAKAQEQYLLILDKNPASAEAHYRLGLAYQISGDPIKARAEWRKAVSIDPMHAAARQKLSEKL
jgi:predicted negative regulator of RcsB-dependent stress response